MHTIGNTLDIYLRQKDGSSLSWVTIEQSSPTKVLIAPANVNAGTYWLILESYDNNGGVFSTLKTDTIEVTVT